MKRRDFLISGILTPSIFGLVACQKDPAHILMGKSVSFIKATTIDGDEIDFSKFHKPILVRFFGLWCAPCLADEKYWMEAVSEIRQKRDMDIIEIHVGEVPTDSMNLHEWTAQRPKIAHIPIIYDKDKVITNALQIPGTPSILLIDSNGKIIDHSWPLKSSRNAKIFAQRVTEFAARK